MYQTRKHLFKNFAILFFSLFFSLGICEIFFRYLSDIPLDKREGDHHKLFVEYDPLLGWRKIPNNQGMHVTSEYKISERINSRGIRGPEYTYDKPPNEYRILILGDSFAEGYTVDFNDLFSEVLKQRLNTGREVNYEVINTGTAGYSPDQELLFFQNEGKKYHPDLTILMLCDNDILYNRRNSYWRGNKPRFKLKNGKLELTNVPVPKPEISSKPEGYNSNDYSHSLSDSIKTWLYKHSYFYNFLRDRLKRISYINALAIKLGLADQSPQDAQNPQNTGREITLIPEVYRIWEKPYSPELCDAWKITEAIILQLEKETHSIQSKLLIFYIPSRAGVYEDAWEATKRAFGISGEYWNPNQVGIELEVVAKRNNIDYIISTPLFQAKSIEMKTKGKQLYFLKDGHWNVDGHRLTGEILAEYINANYL